MASRTPRRLVERTELRAATVREEMARRIEEGTWKGGDRLPAEPELASAFGVSRATLRDALRSLEEDGFVTRTRGAGTFVTHRPRLKNNLDVNFGVTDLIRSMGMRPGTEAVGTTEGTCLPDEAERLVLAADARVFRVRRVRTADGRPVVLSTDVVPGWLLDGRSETVERLGDASLYELLERELGVTVRQGVASIRPANAGQDVADLLRVPQGTLLLYLLQVDYDPEGRPVLLSHEHHVADAFEITVVRRGPGPRAKERR
jgi:GntR family transcriptional regulator